MTMCEECREIDGKISHLRTLMSGVLDQRTIAMANNMIEELKARKTALHSRLEASDTGLR
jgi:hypothetical protein